MLLLYEVKRDLWLVNRFFKGTNDLNFDYADEFTTTFPIVKKLTYNRMALTRYTRGCHFNVT